MILIELKLNIEMIRRPFLFLLFYLSSSYSIFFTSKQQNISSRSNNFLIKIPENQFRVFFLLLRRNKKWENV